MKTANEVLILMFILFISAFPAHADSNIDSENPWERFSISMGGFVANLSTDLNIGSDRLGLGVNVDVEEALNLDTSVSIFRMDALWRFGSSRRHRIDFGYFDIRRNSRKELGREITIGDETFTPGTIVESYFNMQIFRGAYNFSFLQDDRIDAAFCIGLFMMPIEFGISDSYLGKEESDFIAPFPTLGIHFDFAFTPKLIFKQSIDLFFMEYDQFKGRLSNISIKLEYNPWKHFGFGVGLDSFNLEIEADGEDYPEVEFIGKIKSGYSGLLLYITYKY